MAQVRTVGDRILVWLDLEERTLLERLPVLIESVTAGVDDPAAARLHPDAYPGDDDASDEFAAMTVTELARARRGDGALLEGTLGSAAGEGLAFDDAAAWIRVIGDARLVLAARAALDVGEELPDDPAHAPVLALIHFLGALQGEIVEALMMAMVDT
jgi:hypothetical protein